MLLRSKNKRMLELTQVGASKKPRFSVDPEDSVKSVWTGKDRNKQHLHKNLNLKKNCEWINY